jgi:AcrR family transcriptional regulator
MINVGKEIAREAGMSQGNVCWFFKSKEDLLKAVLADGFAAARHL